MGTNCIAVFAVNYIIRIQFSGVAATWQLFSVGNGITPTSAFITIIRIL